MNKEEIKDALHISGIVAMGVGFLYFLVMMLTRPPVWMEMYAGLTFVCFVLFFILAWTRGY